MKLNRKIHGAVIVGLTALMSCHEGNRDSDARTTTPSLVAVSKAGDKPIEHLDQISLLHLAEQPVVKYPWGEIRWLMGSKIDPQSSQTFGIVRINPGQKNALHLHPNCEELLYVLSGTGESIVADKTVLLHPGDLVRIPAHVLHQATVTSKEPLIAVISYSSPDRQVINYGTTKE
jgi:mannose-6-phosphate isomerase-like protein (cupin superfamily)